MNVEDLNENAVERTLNGILEGLNEFVDDYASADEKRILLTELVIMLKDFDYDDFFGTEGWEHRFL